MFNKIKKYFDKNIPTTINDPNTNLIWVDLETGGLDSNNDCILEIAVVVTNRDLETLYECNLAIKNSAWTLNGMCEWSLNNHAKTGLIDRCKKSRITLDKATKLILKDLEKYSMPIKSPMCGSSVWFDRAFLKRLMPELHGYFHYRNLDTSSFNCANMMWSDIPRFEKKRTHKALDDVRESIAEMKHIKLHLYKK